MFSKKVFVKCFVARFTYYDNVEGNSTLIMHNSLIGFGSGENGGKFHNGLDAVSRGSSDFDRASNGVAAKVQFLYPSQKVVTCWTSWLHNPNKTPSFEASIGQ